jgi:hypothetical protein
MSLRKLLLSVAACLACCMSSAQAGGLSSQLVLSSAWCSFTYNQISGRSSTLRVVFSSNGTYRYGGRNEGSSSNMYGSVASQSDGGGGGYWQLQSGELFLAEGGPFRHVQTQFKRDSSGLPVIISDGREYIACN